MSFSTIIDVDYFEFLRFTVDAMGGLPVFADLLAYPLNDTSLPNSERTEVDELLIQRFEHPEYGPFEQLVTLVPTGQTDPRGAAVSFLYIQRCYVIGTRRYIVTAVTNASMVELNDRINLGGRAGEAIRGLFDGFRIDVAAASPIVSETDSDLRDAALAAIESAQVLETGSATLNNRYRALLFYIEAARLSGRMSKQVLVYDDAMARVRGQRNALTDALNGRRDRIRDRMNVRAFDEALLQADELEAVVDGKDHAFPPWYVEEWSKWAPPAREDLNARKNAARRQ
jgi:hypothetical protein